MRRQPRATVLSPIVSQRLTPTLDKEHHSGLDRLAKLADTGEVTPSIERSEVLALTAFRGRRVG